MQPICHSPTACRAAVDASKRHALQREPGHRKWNNDALGINALPLSFEPRKKFTEGGAHVSSSPSVSARQDLKQGPLCPMEACLESWLSHKCLGQTQHTHRSEAFQEVAGTTASLESQHTLKNFNPGVSSGQQPAPTRD